MGVSLLFLVCFVPGLVCAASITITQPDGGSGFFGPDGSVTFNIKNTNSYPIVLTDLGTATRESAVVDCTVTLYMKTTPVTSDPRPIDSGNGWNVVASAIVAFPTADVIQPAISGMSVVIPANTEYGFLVRTSTGGISTANAPITVLIDGGVELTVGLFQARLVPAGPIFSPRQFRGFITFAPFVMVPTE